MSRRFLPVLLGAALLILTAVAALTGFASERTDQEREREYAAAQIADGLDLLRRDLGGRIRDVAGLFETSERVTPGEFRSFTARILRDSEAVSFGWNVMIDDVERAAYERAHGVKLVELAPDGSLKPAPRRKQYVVTELAVSKSTAGQSTLGFVSSADFSRGYAMDIASLDGEPRITSMVMLADERVPGFEVYTPAYADPGPDGTRGTEVIGFASASYRVQDLAMRLAPSLPHGFAVRISVAGQEVFRTAKLDGPIDEAVVDIGGRPFTVQVARTGDVGAGINPGTVALIVGLLITVAVMLLARQIVMRADRAREQRDRAIQAQRWQERATRQLLGHLPDLAVMHFDHELRFTRVTGGLVARMGYSAEAIEGQRVHDLLPEEGRGEIVRCMETALAGREGAADVPPAVSGNDHYWMQTLPVAGETPGGILAISNVTPLVEAQRAQSRAEERFRKAFDDGPVGMALISRDTRLVEVNAALCELLGCTPQDVVGVTAAELSHPADAHVSAGSFDRLVAGERVVHFEQRYLKADGTTVWVGIHVSLLTDDSGRVGELFLAQVLDIGERVRFEEQLRHLADHDPLTGIPNRRAFEQAVDAHAEAAALHGSAGVVMMIDLDHFKSVNDVLGHDAGDALLVGIARDLRDALRDGDTIARLGGDEFAVLLPRLDPADAASVAGKLIERVRARGRSVDLGDAPTPTATIGVATFGGELITGAEALRAADRAMYAAKAASRDAFAIYDPAVHGPAPAAHDGDALPT